MQSHRRYSGRRFAAALCGMVLWPAALAQTDAVTAVQTEPDGMSVTLPGGTLKLQVWSDKIVRVLRTPAVGKERQSLAVVAKRPAVPFDVKQNTDALVLKTASLRVTVARATGAVAFADAEGHSYLEENPGSSALMPIAGNADGLLRLRQEFKLPHDEGIYGLGQHPTGVMNLNGTSVHLQQANRGVGVPMLLSGKGYGLLWDNASVTDVHVSPPEYDGRLAYDSEAGRAIDYYFIAGPSPDGVIAGYRFLTGAAPMMARWTWGFWQSKEHYNTQDELVGIIKRYRSMNVPVDAVIQDWFYWPKDQWGSHRFDPARYPDPHKMLAGIHAMHAHSIVSVWPRFDQDTDTLPELQRANAIFPRLRPNVYPAGVGYWYDPFNTEGRKTYWRQISQRLGRLGFDGYWLDASEAELSGNWGEMRDLTTADGSGLEVYNAYPLMHTTAVYQGQRRDFPQKRAFILTRSAWAGQQRNAAVTWSGDIWGTWETLRRQIPAGLNFVASGIPYWNTDIGAFFGGDPQDPAYAELFVRWFQYGAFNPMFRVHGTSHAKEIWRFDPGVQDILIAYDRLRYRLLPYIYSVSWRVTHDGYTMMRPLVMDFAGDPQARETGNQFLFGPDLMAAPVTMPHAQSRNVYLPGKGVWYDFWTGAPYKGGTTVDAAAPLETMPLFVRAGAVLPMGPVVQYADEAPDAPLEIRVYRGADGRFTLYDDEGNGYGYERGRYATIGIVWDEAKQTLTFEARKGSYPGMARVRVFNVVWAGNGAGAGAAVSAPAKVVHYTGKRVTMTP